MLLVNEGKWIIYDPDKILGYKLEGFDTGELKFGADIHPREDMMQLTHKESNCIIDFGYYGCEIKLDGFYAVHVIDGNLEEAWYHPLERHESKDFLEGIANVQTMLDKYT
ncbi:hypothetical protein [Marinobacterium lacunae]|uniref:hypothetical protein n=1 Tax=Marinobacterium lacunae TaxID=1232683 RepID=UPI000561ABF6|nr:hypothetical protein [Marinobacterium lacunae]